MLWHSKKNHHQILSMQQSFQSGNSINLGDFCSWISCTIIKTNIFSHFAVAHENRRKMARLNKQWRTLQCVNSNVIIILFLTMTHIEKFLLKHSMTTFFLQIFYWMSELGRINFMVLNFMTFYESILVFFSCSTNISVKPWIRKFDVINSRYETFTYLMS